MGFSRANGATKIHKMYTPRKSISLKHLGWYYYYRKTRINILLQYYMPRTSLQENEIAQASQYDLICGLLGDSGCLAQFHDIVKFQKAICNFNTIRSYIMTSIDLTIVKSVCTGYNGFRNSELENRVRLLI